MVPIPGRVSFLNTSPSRFSSPPAECWALSIQDERRLRAAGRNQATIKFFAIFAVLPVGEGKMATFGRDPAQPRRQQNEIMAQDAEAAARPESSRRIGAKGSTRSSCFILHSIAVRSAKAVPATFRFRCARNFRGAPCRALGTAAVILIVGKSGVAAR